MSHLRVSASVRLHLLYRSFLTIQTCSRVRRSQQQQRSGAARSTFGRALHEAHNHSATKQECQTSNHERFVLKRNIRPYSLEHHGLLIAWKYTPTSTARICLLWA